MIVPLSFVKKKEHALWLAEKYVCEELCNQIEANNPRKHIANFIAAYISKWMPYEFEKIMGIYFNNIPELKADIMSVYS